MALLVSGALAQPADPPQLAPANVLGHYENGVGTSNAASEGAVTQRLIANRPALRPAEVLEFVPGVIVTQHSGDRKANQYFLRGFNLDHGTDFATFVDGMPLNMGQPCARPGLQRPQLRDSRTRLPHRLPQGPYFASEGDFASAGNARISLTDALPRGLAQVTLGENGYRRALLGDSRGFGVSTLLGALELTDNDGPWQVRAGPPPTSSRSAP